jgi:LPXTG-site transpeptidase (sortase) family protein
VSWEPPEARQGRTAVFLLVAAIFVATALAIALVVGAASRSSGSSSDVLVLGSRVADDTSRAVGRDSSINSTTTTSRHHPASTSGSATSSTVTIAAPAIELEAPVYEGVSLPVLDVGPGHWPGTAAPGGYGNVVIAGHRTTSTHPFERIGELAPGDPIVVSDATGAYTYAVEESDVVTPDRLDIVGQVSGRTLTLFASHPPRSDEYRYVVRARLVSAPRPRGH